MTNLSWQPEFELGITTLDNQYKSLFEVLEKLDEAITQRDTTSRLEKISALIKKICIRIYDYEHPLLNIGHDKAARQHILLYRAFLDRIDRLNIEIANGDKITAARKLMYEIKSWSNLHLDHIGAHLSDKLNAEKNKSPEKESTLKRFSGLFNIFDTK